MEVTKDYLERHSEQEFVNKFSVLVDSGAGLIHVRANEVMRAAVSVRKAAVTDNGVYKEWDIVNGFRTFNSENLYDHDMAGDSEIDPSAAIQAPLAALRSVTGDASRIQYFVFIGINAFMENNPHIAHLLLMYAQMLPSSNVCVILITPDAPLPETAPQGLLSLRFETPGIGELKESIEGILDKVKSEFEEGVAVEADDIDRICYVGAGMTEQQFTAHVSLAIVKAGREGKSKLLPEHLTTGVNEGKTDIVNSSDILELYPSADINSIGGMENLKEWVRKRSNCYSDQAKEFGVEAPKGMVFVGPPGTGKSLAAKAVASVLGVPLVRLDFGRVFNSLVGASESRIRSALRMVEGMSPCVLFCDEIDKGLGGIAGGSGGDSGVSMRVLGSFLTWLQDCQYPVFTMVTANNIDGLPPELLRRGRFDAIFATGMPTAPERREVLRIHLAARGRNIDQYPKSEVNEVIDATNNYVPAEIESAVKDGLVDAFDADEEFGMSHVLAAIARMVPLSKAFEQQIKRMSDWAKNNATPASATEEFRKELAAKVATQRRVIKRVRR